MQYSMHTSFYNREHVPPADTTEATTVWTRTGGKTVLPQGTGGEEFKLFVQCSDTASPVEDPTELPTEEPRAVWRRAGGSTLSTRAD